MPIKETKSRLVSEALLDLGLLLCPDRGHVIPRSVIRSRDLVERVVGVLLELLPDSGLPLIQAQTDTAAVLLHLFQSSLFVLGICGGVSAFGMSVDLVVLAACQSQSVESVVDAGCADSRRLIVTIELRKIKTARLLNWSLGLLGGLSGGVGVVFSLQSSFLGLLLLSLSSLGCLSFPICAVSNSELRPQATSALTSWSCSWRPCSTSPPRQLLDGRRLRPASGRRPRPCERCPLPSCCCHPSCLPLRKLGKWVMRVSGGEDVNVVRVANRRIGVRNGTGSSAVVARES